jgi:membrane-bound metal-dependent hydrolase YbcI (DUF457 family)
MPQNGIHAIVGIAARKWVPKKEWLLLGVVLGNMFPDLDNLVTAYATLALGQPSDQAAEIYHRTFTHSVFTIVAMVILFSVIAAVTKNEKWKNFGVGFGVGILLHILVDLVLWFNGVQLFWPLGGELNFWAGVTVPTWLKIILDTGEFLAFGLYFMLLVSLSQRHNTDAARQKPTRTWAYIEFALFVVFTGLFFAIGTKGLHYQIFGALYLISLIVGMTITTRMKATVEAL